VPTSPLPQGTYKDELGSSLCQLCEAGKYSATLAAPSAEACRACPRFMTSSPGAPARSYCVCAPGFSGPDGVGCLRCPEGTFKPSQGSEACGQCPPRSHSASGSTTMLACECIAGHTGPNGGPCASCPAGKYKPATGALNCTGCPPGAAPDSHNRTCRCNDAHAVFNTSAAQCCLPGLDSRADGKCGGAASPAAAVSVAAVTASTNKPAPQQSGALETGPAVAGDEGGWVGGCAPASCVGSCG
jgi:hypothetical protein